MADSSLWACQGDSRESVTQNLAAWACATTPVPQISHLPGDMNGPRLGWDVHVQVSLAQQGPGLGREGLGSLRPALLWHCQCRVSALWADLKSWAMVTVGETLQGWAGTARAGAACRSLTGKS